jgi:aryl-phospho-beta-D-glucosidase BglC (GH1 family)
LLLLTPLAWASTPTLTISGSPKTQVTVGTAYSFQPVVTDSNKAATLKFTINNKPSWATFSATTGLLAGTVSHSGAYPSIFITVSDGQSSKSLAPFTITATAASGGTPPSAGALALSAASYTALQSAGSLSVSITRSGGSTGAVSVKYATADGTGTSGTAYTATSGTLSWASGDSSAKSVKIPLVSSPAFVGTKTFGIALSGASGGAALGTPTSATVSIKGAGSAAALSIRVRGNLLVDANGDTVQLRGADVSGLEFVAIQGWDAGDPWGGMSPNLQALKAWKLNAVRFPLNEASWLGLTTYDWPTGSSTVATARKADPGNNYKQTVIDSVNAATAAGFYVILDLHISSPNAVVPGVSGKVPTSPTQQNAMADADHAPAFWSSVANTFKGNPAVIFDLFNEPHIDNFQNVVNYRDATAWKALRDGGTCTQFITNGVTVNQSFQTAGMQAMLNAVRSTGSTNVVMGGSISWDQDTSQWVAFAPSDPAKQLAASWHAYPQAFSGTGAAVPGYGTANYTWAQAILAAGYPVIVGETGDHSSSGSSAPFMANFLPWADKYGVSVIGWTWDAWGGANDDLIKDKNGTPTDGFGQAYKAWTVNHP